MKVFLTAILFSLLFIPVQKKVSDREIEGFKGNVKTAEIAYVEVVNSRGLPGDNKRAVWGIYTFAENGSLVKMKYPATGGWPGNEIVFSLVDGFKTFKSVPQEETEPDPSVFRIAGGDDPPIEGPEKLTPPDERFEHKYVYEYDSVGRVAIERQYLNTGELFQKQSFTYDKKGRISEEILNTRVAFTKFVNKYDDKGTLLERLEDRDIKGEGTDSKSKNVYSEYVFDQKGNWTERKSIWYFEVDGKPLINVKMDYRTFVYF